MNERQLKEIRSFLRYCQAYPEIRDEPRRRLREKRREIESEAKALRLTVATGRTDIQKWIASSRVQLEQLGVSADLSLPSAPQPRMETGDDAARRFAESLDRAKGIREKLDQAARQVLDARAAANRKRRMRRLQMAEYGHRFLVVLFFVGLLAANHFLNFWQLILVVPPLAGMLAFILTVAGPFMPTYERFIEWAREVNATDDDPTSIIYGKWYYEVVAILFAWPGEGNRTPGFEITMSLFASNLAILIVMGILKWMLPWTILYGGLGLIFGLMLLPVWRAQKARRAVEALEAREQWLG